MRTMKRVALCAVLQAATCCHIGQGGESTTTNLVGPREIVMAARRYSPTVRMAAGEVGAAEARRRQAQGARWPVVDLRLQAFRYQGLEPFELNGVTVIDAIEDRIGGSVGATLPLYTGGRLSAASAGAKHGRQAAAEAKRAAESDVTLQALTAFWTWSKAFHGQSALEAALTRMETHAADIRNRRSAGLATEHEVLATEVVLEQMRLRLETSRRGVKQSRAWIAYLAGEEPASNAIPRRAEGGGEVTVPSEQEALQAARGRAEVAARRSELSAFEAMVRASGGETLPQVALTARYEQANPNMMNIPPRDEWQDVSFVGATVTWTILDWGVARAKVAEARARSLQARARLEQTEAAVAFQVREARIGLEDARGRIRVAERAEESARKSLQAVTDLWHGGLARHAEVLDAHTQLAEAEYQVLAARADAALARAALEHATGGPVEEKPGSRGIAKSAEDAR